LWWCCESQNNNVGVGVNEVIKGRETGGGRKKTGRNVSGENM